MAKKLEKNKLEEINWKQEETTVCIETVDNVERFLITCPECNNLLAIPLTNLRNFLSKKRNEAGSIYA